MTNPMNKIISESRYFTDYELELMHEWAEKEIKSRKSISNEAHQARAHEFAAKVLNAIFARKVAKEIEDTLARRSKEAKS